MMHPVDTVRQLISHLLKTVLEHSVEATCTCSNEAKVRALYHRLVVGPRDRAGACTYARVEHLGLVLGVKLCAFVMISMMRAGLLGHNDELRTDEVRMVPDLEDLHTLARLVLSNEVKTSSLQALNVLGVDFVSVAMPLLDLLCTTVQSANLGPIATGLEDSLPGSKTHGASHIVLVELRHRNDNAVAGCGVELFRVGT